METYAVALYIPMYDEPLSIHVLSAESELDALKEGVIYLLQISDEKEGIAPYEKEKDYIYTSLDSVEAVKCYLISAEMVCAVVKVS